MLVFCILLKREKWHRSQNSLQCLRCQNVKLRDHRNMGALAKLGNMQSSLGSELGLSKCSMCCRGGLEPHTVHEEGARTFLGDHPAPSDPFCGAETEARLLQITDAALFTKDAGPELVPPARPQTAVGGGVGVSQLSLGGQGQVSLTVGAVFPPGALAGLLPSGSRVGSRCQHCHLRKALSTLGSPGRTAGRGRPGVPSRSPGVGPGR